jgi:N-methylhydantoinase B
LAAHAASPGPAHEPRPRLIIDAVTFAVLLSRLSGIVQEMQDSIFRTGYSTIVRESHDASCMLMDADGEVVGEHVILPLHVGSLPAVCRAIKHAFGDDLHPGDVFITNHPYLSGVPHSMDLAVVAPVFAGGRLIAYSGSIAHKSDLGGVIPGTGYAGARELFQEGIQFPPVRYLAGDAIQRDVEAIVRANSRTPELVLGDIRGQIGVARLGERRLHALIERYGLEVLLDVFAQVHRVSEERLRAELRHWPDGSHEAEAFVDTDGIDLERRIRYHVRATKTGDRLLFDFSDSDDQVQGPINIQPALARSCLYYALVGFVDPKLPNNGGVARVVETRFRKGSVLDPYYPAAGNTYMASTIALTEAALQALSGFVPSKRHAGNGGVGGNSIAGTRPDGSAFVQYELIGSAYGGMALRDGASGIEVLLSNGMTAPIEILETEYPTRVERFELIVDSGGAGRHRGGLAPRRAYRILTDDAQWTLRGGRHLVPAFGNAGGASGRCGNATLNPTGAGERALPSRFSGVRMVAGDVAQLEKAGGGGFGDPRTRPFDEIVDDVLDGYVSRAAAVHDYGADPARLDAALESWSAS